MKQIFKKFSCFIDKLLICNEYFLYINYGDKTTQSHISYHHIEPVVRLYLIKIRILLKQRHDARRRCSENLWVSLTP